jgi:hypothetical protein
LPHNGGRLSVALPREWFEAALSDLPVIVVRRRGRAIGYLVSASFAAQANIPII